MEQTIHKCFRCGALRTSGENFGEATIAGYYSDNGFPYYNRFILCNICHNKLTVAIKKCLFSADEE